MKIQKNDVFLDFNEPSQDDYAGYMDEYSKDTNQKELTKEEKKEIKKEALEILKKQEVNKKDTGIKQELTWEQKVSDFFNSIEFLSLDDAQKEEVAVNVKKDSAGDKLYWIEIILSSGIAALGLLQNSVAVVIGAMLIAPLLRPINGLSFSIARGVQSFFAKSFKVLAFSVFLSILMGILVSKIIGLNLETHEILTRSTPNIIDFFIALLSGIVAVLSLRFARLGESIAGVAMAASLMPPLAVVGIEIHLSNYFSAFGAFTLFGANLIAILFVGTIFFWLYGFTPHNIQKQTNVFKRLSIVLFIGIIILVPLLVSFNNVKTNYSVSNEVKIYLTQFIRSEVSNFYITDVEVLSNSKDLIVLKVDLKLPEGVDASGIINDTAKYLSKIYKKEIEFDIEMTRLLKIKQKN